MGPIARVQSCITGVLVRIAKTLTLSSSSPHPQAVKGAYYLRRYNRRSALTFVGPWCLFALYAYASFAFLNRPPLNNVISNTHSGSGRWIYYVWFIVAVFTPDWSRTALSNIEAAALMNRRLAPLTSMQLMWHTDTKWANPNWWFRALRVAFHQRIGSTHHPSPAPTGLWAALAMTTSLIYVALPLSGLTMEISNVSSYSRLPAQIFGPGPSTFNLQTRNVDGTRIRNKWQLGGQTSPIGGTLLYAPNGTRNVSLTYFDDLALDYANVIEFFAGPKVHEPVAGKAWGMYVNLSCSAVDSSQLKMLRIDHASYSVKGCTLAQLNSACDLTWQGNSTFGGLPGLPTVRFPAQLAESGPADNNMSWSYLAAADGYTYAYGKNHTNPYTRDSNHDDLTFDAQMGLRPSADLTTAMFEMYLVEACTGEDDVMASLINETYPGLVKVWNGTVAYSGLHRLNATFAGIAVHCDITTAVGTAELDPSHRTFSAFSRSRSDSVTQSIYDSHMYSQLPSQVLALVSMGAPTTQNGYPDQWQHDDYHFSPVWNYLHTAAGLPQLDVSSDPDNSVKYLPYHALRPQDLQLAIYRILGESVVATMDEGGIAPWSGELYSLQPATYLVPGLVPWVCVLVLLGLWASIISIASIWVMFFAGPRWAASLDGFEMFKFGAQYSDIVNRFDTVDFRGCDDVLKSAPGMVGMLAGTSGAVDPRSKLGFIGLSENVASGDVMYTLDRNQAATTRPV